MLAPKFSATKGLESLGKEIKRHGLTIAAENYHINFQAIAQWIVQAPKCLPRFSGAEVTPLRQVTVQIRQGCGSLALNGTGSDCKTLQGK
ncbi:hypothetical protein BH10CHL1_BH10CHL1_14660 [soil metagenome]